MRKDKILKILTILIIMMFILILIIPNCYATDVEEVITNMNGVGSVQKTGSKIKNAINMIIKLIQIAGSGISVIMVTMLGVKYMLAAPSEKADYKKQATPILIGCVLLFAATNLIGIIANVGNGLNPPLK